MPELCGLVKKWSAFCEEFSVSAVSYEWVKRENNKLADELSRVYGSKWAVTPRLRAELERRMGRAFQEPEDGGPSLLAPDWNDVPRCVDECRRARLRACVVVPVWPSRSWWPALANAAEWRRDLSFEEAFVAGAERVARPAWRFAALYCDFSRKRTAREATSAEGSSRSVRARGE